MRETLKTVFKISLVIAFLYLFLLSISLMGASFKGFGKDFADRLIRTTSNPFVGLLIGILATSIVQSSSTITSIVVGIVGSGGLSVTNAIPIVIGSNIGTTVTSTLVALGHVGRRREFRRAIGGAALHDFFNLICVLIMFPLELMTGFLEKSATWLSHAFQDAGGVSFTSPIKVILKPAVHLVESVCLIVSGESKTAAYILMLILSMAFLFLALYFIVKVMKSLVIDRAEIVLNNVIAKNGVLAILAGLMFTALVQSSSITTSLLVPMVAAGILTVESIFPITMGANIGTTVTAILASFATGNIAATTIAFSHFLFNVIGVAVIYPIPLFRNIPIRLAHMLGVAASRKKRYAFYYVVGVFFILPIVCIFISKLFQ